MKKISAWIGKYTEGYQVKSGEKAPLGKIIRGLLTSPDYSMKDIIAIIKNGYFKNKSLLLEMMKIDLTQDLPNIQVPYMIMQGSSDIVTSTKSISEFVLKSQNKNLTFCQIDNSAHFPSANAIDKILTDGMQFILE